MIKRFLSLIFDSLATNNYRSRVQHEQVPVTEILKAWHSPGVQVLYFCRNIGMAFVLPTLVSVKQLNNLRLKPTNLAAINFQIFFVTVAWF